jgi:putative lipoprotein
MFGKLCRTIGGVVLICLLTAFFSAGAEAATTENELYVVKDGRAYVLVKTSDEPEVYIVMDEPGVSFVSDGSKASLRFGNYSCDNYVLLRSTESDDEIILTADDVNYRMQRVLSASGAKYEAVGDPSTTFWSKGNYAVLTVKEMPYINYDVWLPFGGIWIPEEGVPTEVEWQVKSIEGVDVIESSGVTLTFGKDGRAFGFASVNNYNAPWMITGSRIIISTAAVTRMMGSEELMQQEEAFLKALTNVTHFKPLKDGLILLTKNDDEIVLVP